MVVAEVEDDTEEVEIDEVEKDSQVVEAQDFQEDDTEEVELDDQNLTQVQEDEENQEEETHMVGRNK